MTTIILKVPDEAAARRDALTEDAREAAEARQRRREAGARLLALADKGFNLGGIRISRDELYEEGD